MNILDAPISRGMLWRKIYTWREGILNHAAQCSGGCCRFLVNPNGVWLVGDGSRSKVYRTKLPKGAEAFAREQIRLFGLVPSSRTEGIFVCPKYA